MVGSSGCTYTTLRNYNLGSIEAPLCPQLPSMNVTTVPQYCPNSKISYPPRYDTLHHGQSGPGCGGYFNVLSAYPDFDQNGCGTQFVNRDCDGYIDCGPLPPVAGGSYCP